jgi:hypothetical protein
MIYRIYRCHNLDGTGEQSLVAEIKQDIDKDLEQQEKDKIIQQQEKEMLASCETYLAETGFPHTVEEFDGSTSRVLH